MEYTNRYAAAITAAERENQKILMERTAYKANKPIVESLSEINQSLNELKGLVSDMIGILKYMDLNAYGQHTLQKLYENIPDEQQG